MHTDFDVVLFDLSSVFYRSYYANTEVNSKGNDVGAIKTTLLTLQSIVKRHSPKKIVIVADGKGGSRHKKKIFPDYKSQRSFGTKLNLYTGTDEEQGRKSKENFVWQMRVLFNILSLLPMRMVIKEGYEADELVAYISQKYYKNKTKLIVSSDKDFHQLINDNCYIYSLDTKNIVHYEFLEKKWETPNPNNLPMIRAILGDVSDNIYGIYGMKIKSLKKYLPELFLKDKNIETFDTFMEYLQNKKDTIDKIEKKERTTLDKSTLTKVQFLLESEDKKYTELKCKDILKRNFELMQLHDVEIEAGDMIYIGSMLEKKLEVDLSEANKQLKENDIQLNDYYFYFWEKFNTNNNTLSNLT